MAYSQDIREQALTLCQKGYTDDQVSEKLDISKYTIGTWKKRLFETGSLEKKKVKRKSGTPYKYKPEKIKEFLDKSKQSNITGSSKDDKVQKFQKSKKKDKSQNSETSPASKGKTSQDFKKPKKKKNKLKIISKIY